MRRVILFAVVSVALVVAGCGGSTTAALTSDDVAVVGNEPITKDDLQSLLDRAKAQYAQGKQKFPQAGTTQYEQLKSQAITLLVNQAEISDQAKSMGIHISDKQVDKSLADIKKTQYGGSQKRLEADLKKQGLTMAQARDYVRQNLETRAVYNRVAKVSDSDVQQYYNAHKAQYAQPETRDVRHILVTKKSLADQLYTQLKGGANFATLAKKYSKDPGSASNGGKLTITKGQTVPQFDKVAFSLQKGQLSKPVHTQYGYHIIQALSGIKPSKTSPLSAVRSQIESQLKNEKVTKWLTDTKKHYCDGKIKYQVGYQPNPDPCATVTAASTT